MAANTENSTIEPKQNKFLRWLPLIIVALVIAVFAFTGANQFLSLENLVRNYSALKQFVADNLAVALLSYVALYIVAVAFSFPAAWVLTVASGIFFGWWIAGLATIIGATLGASVLYWVASTSFGEHLRESAGPFVQKIRAGMQENAVSYMLFLRLVPAFPFMLVNIVPAILGVNFAIYFWTTLVGIAPGTFAYAYAGEGIASVVEAQAQALEACTAAGGSDCGVSLALGDIVTPQLLIAFSVLGLVSLLPVVIKHIRKDKKSTDQKAANNG